MILRWYTCFLSKNRLCKKVGFDRWFEPATSWIHIAHIHLMTPEVAGSNHRSNPTFLLFDFLIKNTYRTVKSPAKHDFEKNFKKNFFCKKFLKNFFPKKDPTPLPLFMWVQSFIIKSAYGGRGSFCEKNFFSKKSA